MTWRSSSLVVGTIPPLVLNAPAPSAVNGTLPEKVWENCPAAVERVSLDQRQAWRKITAFCNQGLSQKPADQQSGMHLDLKSSLMLRLVDGALACFLITTVLALLGTYHDVRQVNS